jgi:hypothetical protein
MKNVIGGGLYLAVAFIGLHMGRLILASMNLPNDGDPQIGQNRTLQAAQAAGSGRAASAPVARTGWRAPVTKQGRR